MGDFSNYGDDFFDFAARGSQSLYRRKPLLPNATYHVFNRREDRAPVFRDDCDRDQFVAGMQRLLGPNEYRDDRGKILQPVGGGLELLGFSVLLTHYHIILRQIEHWAMTEFMRRLMTSYTMRHNRRHQLSGPLFDERYQARPIESTRHLRVAIAYTHANPDSPLDYQWSGQGYYLDPVRAKANPWIATETGLDLYGGRGDYLEWFLRAVESRKRKNAMNELLKRQGRRR